MKISDRYHLNRLRHIPRFIPGHIKLEGLKIQFTDSLTLYYGYHDIFINNIYHFNSEKKDPVIIDLGGYIGLSVLYFKNIYPESLIHVFEPDPDLFNILQKNLCNNRISKVFPHNSGAGLHEEIKKFYPEKSGGGNPYNPSGTERINVNIIKLSSFIDGPIDFIKMNVEGMEYDILLEIESKLFLVRELVLEYHNFSSLPQNMGNILNLLVRNGFNYIVRDIPSQRHSHPPALDKDFKKFNLIYAKNQRDRRINK